METHTSRSGQLAWCWDLPVRLVTAACGDVERGARHGAAQGGYSACRGPAAGRLGLARCAQRPERRCGGPVAG